jgi:hypothetical protein
MMRLLFCTIGFLVFTLALPPILFALSLSCKRADVADALSGTVHIDSLLPLPLPSFPHGTPTYASVPHLLLQDLWFCVPDASISDYEVPIACLHVSHPPCPCPFQLECRQR